MIRIAVCDDDPENLEYMRGKIAEAFKKRMAAEEIETVLFNSGTDIVNAQVVGQTDIVFMDIELGENELGFDVARKLVRQKRNLAIVYMSNHDYYISKSFVCRPLGFVRKHHAAEDLEVVMEEAYQYLQEESRKICFFNNSKPLELPANEIRIVEVFNHDLRIEFESGKELVIRDQLNKHLTELEENGFVLVRRGIAVNVRCIEKIDGAIMFTTSGKTYQVGRDKMNEVKRQWMKTKYL